MTASPHTDRSGELRGLVRSADSDEHATEFERSALTIDALWTDDPYPEYSQDEVLRAYRLGYEDGTR